MVYKCVDATELRLILMWRKRGMSLGGIAGLLGRCKATVSRQVKKSRQKNGTKVGRPASLTDEDVTHIMKVNEALVRKANLRYTVTIKPDLAMKSWRMMCIADFSLTRACPLHPDSHCCLTFGGVLSTDLVQRCRTHGIVLDPLCPEEG